MSVRFHALDAMEEFAPGRLAEIVGWLQSSAEAFLPRLGLDRVDIVVAPTPRRWTIPGWDLNAYAHGIARLTIGVDPTCGEGRSAPLVEQLRTTLAHELHHIRRFRGIGPHDTLGANLAAEGLAQCFQEEVGCPTPNYATAVRGERLGLLAARAKKDWDLVDYGHGRWFYGDRADASWPWSGGYSLGYVLVRDYLDRASVTAAASACLRAEDFRRAVQNRLDQLAEGITPVRIGEAP